ncbi:MAG: hypothetical protein VKK05_07555 [Synechococcus sp.]|nr:hypothetical protein [Synechococcus sp.]
MIASGKVALMIRTLDDAFLTLAAFFTADQLRQAAKSFRQIVNTQGDDIGLLNISSKKISACVCKLGCYVDLACDPVHSRLPGVDELD